MTGDRETQIDQGNYNERIEGDYQDNSISENIDVNIGKGNFTERIEGDYVGTKLSANVINIYPRSEENSDSGKSKTTTSNSPTEQLTTQDIANKQNNQDFYYIYRPPVEEICFQEIQQNGALLRIKGSEQMGQTSLLKKIFEEGAKNDYAQVQIDLKLPGAGVLSDATKFLHWFCRRVTRQLEITCCLEEFWDDMTPNTCCSDYFEDYILDTLESPLILGIDNIDRLFAPEFRAIASDFFGMLRSWWGFANTIGGNWNKLRLIVIYSTEDFPKLNINQSPFNIGTEITLPDFGTEQILDLALKYGLDWSINDAQKLQSFIGGHAFMVHHAIKNLSRNSRLTLSDLLENAATDAGIYANHLQHHWSTLEQDSELRKQLKKIVQTKTPIAIAPSDLYKLDSMGLITKVGNQVQPRCKIYRDYFRERLKLFP